MSEKKKKSTKNSIINKKKINNGEIGILENYLLSQPNEIKNLSDDLEKLYDAINHFIEITEEYKNKIELLALTIIPGYTTEGRFSQAFQGILLFYSEGLNSLVAQLNKTIIKNDKDEVNTFIKQFEEYRTLYFDKINTINNNYEKYNKELQLYQEYLVNEKHRERILGKGVKTFGDIIKGCELFYKEKRKNNDPKNKPSKMNKRMSCDIEDKEKNYVLDKNDDNSLEPVTTNIKDNKKSLIENQKIYNTNISDCNSLLNKIKELLIKEKTSIRQNLFNVCNSFIEGLLKNVTSQKNNYDTQNEVVQGLIKIIQCEETTLTEIKSDPMKLSYLDIYLQSSKD